MLKLNQTKNYKNKSLDSKGELWKNKDRNAKFIELYAKKGEFYHI